MSHVWIYTHVFLGLICINLARIVIPSNDENVLSKLNHQGKPRTNSGTTVNLEDIFKGRCFEYQKVVNPAPFAEGERNCSELWSLFSEAFMYRDPCNVTQQDYLPFVEAAYHDVPPNTHLFWEGVYPFVNKYADRGRRFYTIADTFTGYLVDNLMWCGQKEPPGVNHETCPEWNSCELASDISFWRIASEVYAALAEGTAHVMLNATRENAFNPTSIFAQHELVFIDNTKVPKLRTLLVRDIGVPHRESCGTGSLILLKDIAENTVGVEFECVDAPEQTRHMLCVDNWEDPECSASMILKSQSFLIVNVLILLFIH